MLVRRTTPLHDRVRRARLSVGHRLEGLQRDRRRSCGIDAAGRACARAIACPSRSSRRRPRPRAVTTRTSARRRPAALVGARTLAQRQGADAGALSPRRRARRVARHHPRRHQVRVRQRSPASDELLLDRRGDDARLVALLAGRRLRAGRAAAELRQAVRARLPRVDPLEQAAARARLPDDVVARTREKYLDAYRRLTGRELALTCGRRLESLVREMVSKGILYEDARARVRAPLPRSARSTRPTATSARRRARSACTATPSAARSTSTASSGAERRSAGAPRPEAPATRYRIACA